ncbi:hypothetical protein D3C79_840880 [compost metagenome]
MVPRIAAICVRVKAEISRPRLVVASRYNSPPQASATALPLNGTPNSQRFIATSKARLTRLMARYGACLPSRNSRRVSGVA